MVRSHRSSAPLRGRDDELDEISERISAARSSTGSVLTIEGEPGLGKTRLLEEAARIAGRAGIRFSYAAADPAERVIPLGALMTALFDGERPLLDRAALKEMDAVPEQRYWLL